jgi:hypothetical protein
MMPQGTSVHGFSTMLQLVYTSSMVHDTRHNSVVHYTNIFRKVSYTRHNSVVHYSNTNSMVHQTQRTASNGV